jgi:hypothetical protein
MPVSAIGDGDLLFVERDRRTLQDLPDKGT